MQRSAGHDVLDHASPSQSCKNPNGDSLGSRGSKRSILGFGKKSRGRHQCPALAEALATLSVDKTDGPGTLALVRAGLQIRTNVRGRQDSGWVHDLIYSGSGGSSSIIRHSSVSI